MEENALTTVRLLNDLFLANASQLDKLIGIPAKRLAKEVITLFKILDCAEKDSSGVIESLRQFNEEKTVGMKVHYIHRAGGFLGSFGRVCNGFIKWIDEHEKISSALQTEGTSNKLLSGDNAYTQIFLLRDDLQAVGSPDPDKFPSTELVAETIDAFINLMPPIQESKRLLQEFASASLDLQLPTSINEYKDLEVIEIRRCPKCNTSHIYQLYIERAHIAYCMPPGMDTSDRKKFFTRLFTCPKTCEAFQAKFSLTESFSEKINVVGVKTLQGDS